MSAAHMPIAGAEISLRIGQRVSHGDYKGRRVTGIVRGLDISDERGLIATVLLDEPIVILARAEGDREIRINWQTIPAHELAAFDARDELIAALVASLTEVIDLCAIGDVDETTEALGWGETIKDAKAAIAKATGGSIHG
jgi:hypothetical protein